MRGRPKTPLAVAEASGAVVNHPARYAGRVEPPEEENPPLGDPPDHFDFVQVAIWDEYKRAIWWARESDRFTVELTVLLICDVRLGIRKTETVNSLLRCLSNMGGTACNRTRVPFADERVGTTRPSSLRPRTGA